MSGKYKGRCINFELWYTDEDDQDLNRIYLTLERLIKQDIDTAITEGCNAVIGLLLYEGFLYKDHKEYYDLLKRVYDYGTQKGIKKFVLVCGIVWNYQDKLIEHGLDYTIIPFDYSANAMWVSYQYKQLPNWNSNANKFLFLGGVANRPNRIKLLAKFYDLGLLDSKAAIWSFFPPYTSEDKISCRQLLSNYNDIQYKDFIQYASKAVDDKYATAQTYSRASGKEWKEKKYLETDFFKDPNFIDQQIYIESSISVISEGHVYPPAHDYRFLTEKTWRAVINKHPFILADCTQRKEFAKQQGLDLFEDLFIDGYSDIHLDGVVSNVKHFLKEKDNNKELIKEKINNNYMAFLNVINNNEQTLKDLQQTFSLQDSEITSWFRQKSFDHLFRIPEYKE